MADTLDLVVLQGSTVLTKRDNIANVQEIIVTKSIVGDTNA